MCGAAMAAAAAEENAKLRRCTALSAIPKKKKVGSSEPVAKTCFTAGLVMNREQGRRTKMTKILVGT